jgi:hypothetical protein
MPGRGAAKRSSDRRGRRAPRVTRAERRPAGARRAPCSQTESARELGDARFARELARAGLGDHHEVDRRREPRSDDAEELANAALDPVAHDGIADRTAHRDAEAWGSGRGPIDRDHDEVGAVSPPAAPLNRLKLSARPETKSFAEGLRHGCSTTPRASRPGDPSSDAPASAGPIRSDACALSCGAA